MQGERFPDLVQKNSWGLVDQGARADREKISDEGFDGFLEKPTEVGSMIDQQIMENMMNLNFVEKREQKCAAQRDHLLGYFSGEYFPQNP